MVDDTPQAAETSPAVAPPASAPHRTRNKALTVLLLLILIPAVVIALWIWVALGYTYSNGERAGYLQKISKRGWLCKTWEGEIQLTSIPGSTPQIFTFTTRSDSIANILTTMAGQSVRVHYREHKGI